ncbi:unnamed protein product, partial [Ectocarpus sp. 12 AP-2014]
EDRRALDHHRLAPGAWRPRKRTLRSGEVSAGILEEGGRRSRLLRVSFSLSTASPLTAA